jgi:hypothetical protein
MPDKMLLVITLMLPMGLMMLIAWGVNHRYRSTTRAWLIATALVALILGVFSYLLRS